MVKIRCPVCGGRGRVPIHFEGPMAYYNPETGESYPTEVCPGCNGSKVQEE